MVYKMKFTNILSLGLVLALLMISTSKSYAEQSVIHGTDCQPANLSQALSLGLGWNQFGITNNSPIGGGSFFTVCPVHIEDELYYDVDDGGFNTYLPTSVEVEVAYLDPAAKNISCTFYVTNIGATGGPNPLVVAAANMNVGPNPGIGQSAEAGYIGFFLPGPFILGLDALSMVCAMHPQTRIGHIELFWEPDTI